MCSSVVQRLGALAEQPVCSMGVTPLRSIAVSLLRSVVVALFGSWAIPVLLPMALTKFCVKKLRSDSVFLDRYTFGFSNTFALCRGNTFVFNGPETLLRFMTATIFALHGHPYCIHTSIIII